MSVITLGVLVLSFMSVAVVPAGHVGVKSLFGKVDDEPLEEGFHMKNPFAKVTDIDCRNKELTLNSVSVPSQDQLSTKIDITVKWRVAGGAAPQSYRDTGGLNELESVHLVPKVRSLIREAGKKVKQAEDFYLDSTQSNIQTMVLARLGVLAEKGVIVEEVLLRKVSLPPTVEQGVLSKKEREQQADRQKAELERFKTEQEQKLAQAEAELEASKKDAEKRQVLADASAYEIIAKAKAKAESIKIEGEALKDNPQLIELRRIERWSGQVPTTLMSGDSPVFPMLNLDKDN